MVELIFVACLASAPTDCSERRLLFSDISPMTCLIGAQPELAKWVYQHPAYTVASWKCQGYRQDLLDA